MKKDVEITLLKDKLNKQFFCICIYNTYIYKQYIVKDDLLYTFFLVINFLYKYGFLKIK
jgi:hypothetical protein